ncbi:hypothetical protein CEP53_005107 [Fusarium sp. AF-6]|nr:hypothetical protein CEP53_005107 [Fusarium sp. AF-6]
MVAAHYFLFLMAIGIAAAGKCRPSSPTTTGTKSSLSTLVTEKTVSESATETSTLSETLSSSDTKTLTDSTTETLTSSSTESSTSDSTISTTMETSTASTSETTSTATEMLSDTATETSASEATTSSTTESSTDATTDTTLTTFMTSLSLTETTTQPTTTSSEAAVVVTCPADQPPQCLGTMEIRCDLIIFGISKDSETTLDDCVHRCYKNPSCVLFTYNSYNRYCYLSYSSSDAEGESFAPDWASGTKGTCGQ